MPQIDSTKKVHIIVHGQRNLADPVKEKLAAAGFKKENMVMAGLEKAGAAGEYMAMLWPPMAATEISVSEITGASGAPTGGMGAWGSVATRPVLKLPLK